MKGEGKGDKETICAEGPASVRGGGDKGSGD